MTTTPVFVGIDVAKAKLDVGERPSGKHWQTTNDAAGVARVVERLGDLSPELVVVEATGGREALVVRALHGAGVPVAVVNPRQVRDFARSTGKLAKTDRLDAAVLAHFAQGVGPEPQPPAEEKVQRLGDLLARRRQLLEMQTAEKNRREMTAEWLRGEVEEHITWLEEKLEALNRQLQQAIEQDEEWRAKAELLGQVQGVGPVLTVTLLAELPELGKLDRRHIAGLAGVAPLARDSGQQKGKRSVWGGRAAVRSALYLSCWSAVRHNPALKVLFERLVQAGKPRKVAYVACMRKLLTVLNAMVRDGTAWNPALAVSAAPA